MYIIDIFGDGFLKNMIRNMVRTAVQIATNILEKYTITESLLHCDRTRVGVCAPAHALTLLNVYYGKKAFETESVVKT